MKVKSNGMESILEHLQEIHLTALEAIGSTIVICDISLPEYPIVYCKDSFKKLSGYRPEKIIGRSFMFLHKENHEQEEH